MAAQIPLENDISEPASVALMAGRAWPWLERSFVMRGDSGLSVKAAPKMSGTSLLICKKRRSLVGRAAQGLRHSF